MAEKLATYASRAHVSNVDLITDAYHIAMRPRLLNFPDVFHPDVLHPARTMLILLEDTPVRDARVLAAAALTETLHPALRVDAADAGALGGDVAQMVAAVPNPLDLSEDALVEELVTAERDVALIAVAERLDHARHLHMRERETWPAYHAQTVEIYLPLSARLSEELTRRLERWAWSFERRLS